MHQITLEVPDDLGAELQPYRPHSLDLLRLGLAKWRRGRVTEKDRAIKALFQQMSDEGILTQAQPYPDHAQPPELPLIEVSGQPLSEIVIEQRNRSW